MGERIHSARTPHGRQRLSWTTLPGLYYLIVARRWFFRPWRGPVYYRKRTWRRDLYDVLLQLQGIVSVGGAMPAGLEAAGHEERRLLNTISMSSLGSMLRAFFMAAFLSLLLFYLFALIPISGDPYSGGILLRPPLWLIRWDTSREYSGLAWKLPILYGLPLAVIVWFRLRTGIREAVLLRMRERLENGVVLSSVMRDMRRFFPAHYADLVEAGEHSGQLARILEYLARDCRDAVQQESMMHRHYVYLAMLLGAQGLLIRFMTWRGKGPFSINQADLEGEHARIGPGVDINNFAGTFVDRYLPVPESTERLNHAAEVLGGGEAPFTLPWTAGVLAGLFLLYLLVHSIRRRSGATRYTLGHLAKWIPFAAAYVRRRNEGIIVSLLAKLVGAGMPLTEALKRAANAAVHRRYRWALMRVAAHVEGGAPLAAALDTQSSLFSPGLRSLIRIGERAGMLPEALRRFEERCGEETRQQRYFVQDLILPAGVVAVGVLALGIAVAIFHFHVMRLDLYYDLTLHF